ncbi:MAG: RnfH family protein, partial [Pseudomonadota bacterium]
MPSSSARTASMADGDIIVVEVACALPRTQIVVTLKVPVGTTVAEVIARSGIAR